MSLKVSSCVAYVQLFVGWIVLCLATLALCLVHESAVFFGLSTTTDDLDNVVIYGFWVLTEIGAFFLLLVLATCIMCGCKNVPPGAGFIHLVVDPSLITFICVPLLLIRGLPAATTLVGCRSWAQAAPSNASTTHAHLLLPSNDCDEYRSIFAVVHSDYKLRLSHNATMQTLEQTFQDQLDQWMSSLQCILALPPLLRFLRFRWKMAWQPFIQSTLYLFVQSVEIALYAQVCVQLGDDDSGTMPILSKVATYTATLALCVGCMALLTPPTYIGNHVTNTYLKSLVVVGTLVIDLPFLCLRVTFLSSSTSAWHGGRHYNPGDSLFYVMAAKDVVFLLGLLTYMLKSSHCVKSQYHSLNTTEGCDVEELFAEDQEDFV